jgi:agmatinase
MSNLDKDLLDREGKRRTLQGCDSDYDQAGIVVFGAPFDSTTSYRPGARFAPMAIRQESTGTETYSPFLQKDLSEIMVCDAGDLELPFGHPQKALEQIEKTIARILQDQKTPVMIGGEHLVTLPAIRAVLKKHQDLCVIQFDAHADLRDEYLGCCLSHATVMRRVWDLVGDGRIYQFGIRSGEAAEFFWSKTHTNMTRFGFEELRETLEKLKGIPLYLSIDLDVLDPGIFPGTGTPEHGGISYIDLRRAITQTGITGQVVAADICELSPHYDPSGISILAACTLLRELLLSL